MRNTASMMRQLGEKPLLTEANLATINNETLIMLGDTDDMVDRTYTQQVAGFLPHARFELLPQTPHLLEQANSEMLVEKLVAFFK